MTTQTHPLHGPSGYRLDIDHAKRAEIMAGASPYSRFVDASVVKAAEFDIAAMDPRGWMRSETQARSDCQGFANAALGEGAFTIATGRVIQFSPHYSYRVSQEFDGIQGDNGSSISAGIKVAMRGFCPLKDCPYPSYYGSPITDAMRQAAKAYHASDYAMPRTYQEMLAWMLAGKGPVEWGTRHGFTGSGNVLTNWQPGPGHATTFVAPSVRKDSEGNHYLWLWNSGYPIPGWYEVSPYATQRALDDNYTVTAGITGLTFPKQDSAGYQPMG